MCRLKKVEQGSGLRGLIERSVQTRSEESLRHGIDTGLEQLSVHWTDDIQSHRAADNPAKMVKKEKAKSVQLIKIQ